MAATSWFSFNTSVKYFLRTKRSPASAAAVVITETIRNEIADGKLSRNCIRVVILACNLGSNLSWQRTHDFFRVVRVGQIGRASCRERVWRYAVVEGVKNKSIRDIVQR